MRVRGVRECVCVFVVVAMKRKGRSEGERNGKRENFGGREGMKRGLKVRC